MNTKTCRSLPAVPATNIINASQKATKGSGTCPVCWCVFKTHSSDGTLHRHGPRHAPCPGSDQQPDQSTGSIERLRPTADSNTSQLTQSNRSNIDRSTLQHPLLRGALIKRIPRAARLSCADLLTSILRSITSAPADINNWKHLLSFGPDILSKPKRGGKRRNISTIINTRLREWNSPEQRVEEQEPERHPHRPQHRQKDSQLQYLASAVASKLEDGNYKAAIRLICSEDKPAKENAVTLSALKMKHPAAPNDRRPQCHPSSSTRFEPLQITVADIKTAVRTFPPGSTGGPDGISPQHLKDMLIAEGDTGPLHVELCSFVNVLLNGETPDEVNQVIYGGRLIALEKKDGGVRPITVGYTWRRLAAKCANSYVIDKIASYLVPLQLGVGIPGGCEAAVHATRRYTDRLQKDHVVVKLDFANAFNSVRRDALLEAVAREIPELYRFAYATYSGNASLTFGKFFVTSEEGIQQGDPLGPLEFCIVIQPLLQSLKSSLRIGFLDDLTLGGHVDTVAADIAKLAEECRRLGLELNPTKCEIVGLSQSDADNVNEFNSFRIVQLEDLTLLGSPVQSGRAVDAALEVKCADLNRAVSRLSLLYAHDALVILRNSLSVPKLLYTLRTAKCSGRPALRQFDEILRDGLSAILNISLTDDQWIQASLPVRSGGMGIRSATMLAPSAFLASAAGTSDLQDSIISMMGAATSDPAFQSSLDAWTLLSNSVAPVGTEAAKQRSWDAGCISAALSSLTTNASDAVSQARLLAAQSAHSGDWLMAPPITAVGLRLSDEAIRVAAGLRLGTNLCEPHPCPCGAMVDARGLHGLSCRRSAGRHQRHNFLNDIIWRALGRAKIQATKEPLGLSRTDGKRPDGVTLIPWSRGKCAAWDVTVPDSFALSHLPFTSLTAGAAAERAATSKTTKYVTLQSTHMFVPIAIETAGCWNTDGLDFVCDLGRRLKQVTGDPLELTYLFQRLSIAIQRGNELSFAGSFSQRAS